VDRLLRGGAADYLDSRQDRKPKREEEMTALLILFAAICVLAVLAQRAMEGER